MRNGGIFWGGLLILMGVLFLLNSLGVIAVNVWSVFWPLALILWGLSMLFGAFGRHGEEARVEALALQLKGFEEAAVTVRFGAGRIMLDSGAAPDELLSGSFGGGVEHRLDQEGERAVVELSSPVDRQSWKDRTWDVALNGDIPLTLNLDVGAAELAANLSKTQTKRVALHIGAGRADLTLPEAAGETAVTIEGGAGSVTVRVPDGLAARISGMAAVGKLHVDEERFPPAGSAWQSADYDAATNRAEIHVTFGAGEVKIGQ